jgi:glutathione peroxidase
LQFILFFCILFSVKLHGQDSLTNFHSFSIATATGGLLHFSTYAGKKILLVNTASLDKESSQLQKLQQLQNQYGTKVQVVGLPCTDFNNLEPETEEKIVEKYTQNFGVSFPITIKVVASGGTRHEIYKWLTRKSLNGMMSSMVTDNFQKYLIDEQGHLLGVFDKIVDPLSTLIIDAINQ